jgi:hypothetical protein
MPEIRGFSHIQLTVSNSDREPMVARRNGIHSSHSLQA